MDDSSLNNLEFQLQLEHEELEKYLQEVVFPILPNQQFSGSSSSGGKFIPWLQTAYKYFKNSKYFYPEKLRFIHYTNLNSFLNIINEKCLRLSDFNFFNDPQEFTYPFSKFEFTKSSLSTTHLKSCLYAISFCKYDEKSNPDSFDMWRLYGNDGQGVAFIFSMEQNLDYWEDFYLSKVYYGETDIQAFEDLDERHKKFFKTSKISFNEHLFDTGKDRFPFQIFVLPAFHKHSLYKIENEVRLVKLFNPFDYKHRKHYYSVNKNYDSANYIKLKINTQKDIDISERNQPKIAIEKLILGYRFTNKNFEKIKKVVEDASVHSESHMITTELSRLKKYFE
jgi:hypothetical protein